LLGAVSWSVVPAANTQVSFSYQSSVSNDGSEPLDLVAELNYDNSRTNAPIAVVMHGYSPATGNLANVRANAQRLRDAGFFAISVAMRGRDGSDGDRDSGGLEVYDIYDAVEAVKSSHASLVNPTNIHITGYSGGGGNAMSALTKFPDYFRAGSAFFGMSDYGFDQTNGWYQNGASSGHQSQLRTDIGDPTLGNALILDRYLARASNKASHNNPYSEIHLFVNDNETTCPPINDTTYRDNAIAHAAAANEFNNIRVHIGNSAAPTYKDFDGDMVNDPNELQSWPHGFPTANQQAAAEGWYLNRLLSGQIPQPVLNNEDELFVAGFVKTKRFELRLGDGQNAAGTLDYSLAAARKEFELDVESSDSATTGSLWIDTSDSAGQLIDVLVNGTFTESIVGGGTYHYGSFGDGDRLLLSIHQPGDYNRDTVVNYADYQVWRESFGATGAAAADGNGDGVVDAADYLIWRQFASAPAGQSATAVPEPAGGTAFLMAALAISAGRSAHVGRGWHQSTHDARPRINRLK
jgi:hypothetical protein